MEMPEEKWVLVQGKSEGHPFFMMVNDGLKYFGGKDQFCYCLVAVTELENVQGHNLPTDDEAEILNQIEDIILSELKKYTLPLLIGRETYFGERETLVYFPELKDFKLTIDSLAQKVNSLRSTSVELHHDPEWKNAQRYHGLQANA